MKNLAAKVVLFGLLLLGLVGRSAAGIPVIDGTNLAQNIITAIEDVAQTAKQIQQYKTQLQQYSNMLQNTATPASYIWDDAQATIRGLLSATDTLAYYKSSLGDIDNYLAQYRDQAYYNSSPCFSVRGCTQAQWDAMERQRQAGAAVQKRTYDATIRGLDQQQTNMRADAATLARLQSAAEGATGQMQAIGYANQLASQQANQLLQMRGLLVAQQNMVATRMQYEADEEARMRAASAQFRTGTYSTSPARTW